MAKKYESAHISKKYIYFKNIENRKCNSIKNLIRDSTAIYNIYRWPW